MERPAVARRAWLVPVWALLALGLNAPLAAQSAVEQDTDTAMADAAADSVIGAAVSVGGEDAVLELELSNGRTVQIELSAGRVRIDGDPIGSYAEGGELDRSWRALMEQAAMASTAELPMLLRDWEAPAEGGVLGRQLDEQLELALAGVSGRAAESRLAESSAEDSIERLLARIDELEHTRFERDDFDDDRNPAEAFVHDVVEGVTMLFAALIFLGVMFGVGAALLFFATGRLERVAATVREEPIRSGLIGLAGIFLAFPLWVLVILALAISILGIPLILAWLPIFPLLVALSLIAGWLGVAYAAGDGLVAGKLREKPRFQNAGAATRLVVGIGILLSPFFLAALFQMTSFLDWVGALLFVIGIIANALMAAVGFGAVLSRGRDALDEQRERRAARRRAKAEQITEVTPNV